METSSASENAPTHFLRQNHTEQALSLSTGSASSYKLSTQTKVLLYQRHDIQRAIVNSNGIFFSRSLFPRKIKMFI